MIWTPRNKLVVPRRLQRGNIVYHTEADPQFGNVTWLSDFENQSGEAFTPQIGGSQNWWLGSGSQPSQVDGEISAANPKYGTRSLYWKEVGGAPSAGWQADAKVAGTVYGFTGDFTVETDIYILDNTSAIEIFGLWDFTERQWQWALEGGNSRMDFTVSLTGSNNNAIISQNSWGGAGIGLDTDVWQHIAVCRENDDWFCFLDGVESDQTTSGINDSSVIHIPTDAYFVIGQRGFEDGTGQSEVYLDNIRVTDGVARYTSGFTPPTEAHPNF